MFEQVIAISLLVSVTVLFLIILVLIIVLLTAFKEEIKELIIKKLEGDRF